MLRNIAQSPSSLLFRRQKIPPPTGKARRAVRPKNITLGTMIHAFQVWVNSHKSSHAAAVLVSACLAFFTVLFGAGHHDPNACAVNGGVSPRKLMWWKRRHHQQQNCSNDPFSDSDIPPPHFQVGISRRRAQENWEATRQWRRENDMGTILQRPPARHELIRKLIPTSFYQHDREGNIVVVEKWGEVDAQELKRHGLTHDDLLYAYMFELEWLWTVAAPHDKDKITLIMDVGGITFGQFTAWDTMNLVRDRINIGCNHYPNRGAHLLMVNVPSFFSGVYRLAEPLLSEQTKRKVKLLSESDVQGGAMTKIIHPKQLPPEYGGKCKVPFGHSSVDQKLLRHVQKARRKRH